MLSSSWESSSEYGKLHQAPWSRVTAEVDQGGLGGFWDSLDCPPQHMFSVRRTAGQGHRPQVEHLNTCTLPPPVGWEGLDIEEADELVKEKLS